MNWIIRAIWAILRNMFVSWKTSAAGLIAFIHLSGPEIAQYYLGHTGTDPKSFWVGLTMLLLGIFSRDGDKSSEQTGAGNTGPDVTKKFSPPTTLGLLTAALFLTSLTGCGTTVQIDKVTSDTKKAVVASSGDINFLAGYIADTWAAKETECATRNYKAALASHAVQAQVVQPAGVLVNAAAGPVQTTITTVDENVRAAEDANNKRVLAQIEIGRQQLRATIIQRYGANIQAAQALLDGQANYYSTSATTNSTLQGGVNAALSAFQALAPTITAAVTKK